MRVRLAHSPDADDAYMFYGVASGAVRFPATYVEFLADIETLNKLALAELLDVTAVSTHALAYVCDKYYVLRVGASMGEGYGPVVVSNGGSVRHVAVPGRYTTAALLLQLAMPGVKTVEIPFDKILEAVAAGVVDAGVVIHEGQITYHRLGLKKVVDLGEWWLRETGLPTPLGLDVVRAALGRQFAEQVAKAISDSIKYADAHREDALRHAQKFSRGLSIEETARFVDMYVNQYTRDMGPRGEKAISTLLEMASERGLTPRCKPVIV
ncbi:MAG: MqnA/MqnD/SBP family protein [Pyrobaculum sp.]